MRGKIVAHLFAHDGVDVLGMRIAEDRLLAQRAEVLSMLAAVRNGE